MRAPSHRSARAGFTLVEAIVAGALLVLLLSSAVLAARGGMGAFRATQDASDAETRVRRALDRVVFELLSAGASELLPNPTGDFGTADLQFRKPVGLVGTAPQWGQTLQLAWERAAAELDDGLDNDGNGLVDEGELVFTRDVGGDEHRIVLCRGVAELLEGEQANGDDDNGNGVRDEAGFNVHRVGDVLFVRLTVEQAGEGGVIARTLETSVRLRN
jgi:type II secretory pathway pseudopilin PulG